MLEFGNRICGRRGAVLDRLAIIIDDRSGGRDTVRATTRNQQRRQNENE
jgi:hypothetical protein